VTSEPYQQSHAKGTVLGRLWAAFRSWLFARPANEVTKLFPNLDAEVEAANLDLSAKARNAGSAGQPDENSARAASYETTLDSHVRQLFGQSSKRVATAYATIDAQIHSIELKRSESRLEAIRKGLDADCGEVIADSKRELDTLESESSDLRSELDLFRSQHFLTDRTASYPTSRLLGFSILLALVLAESVMNGVFFAEGSDLGLLGGLMEAIVISVVNIAAAGMVANWPFRWTRHISGSWRFTGYALSATYAALLLTFLVLITLYRDAFTTNPDNAMQVAFANFSSGSWTPDDMSSLLFFALSLLFAIIALIDVFRLDDPYPSYGAIDRRTRNAVDMLDDERDSVRELFETKRDKRRAQLEDLSEELHQKTSMLGSWRSENDRIQNGSSTHTKELEHLHTALIGQFRQENAQARSTPVPQWFHDTAPPLNLGSMVDNQRALPDVDGIRSAMSDLQSRVASLDIALTNRYADAINEIDRKASVNEVESSQEPQRHEPSTRAPEDDDEDIL
jgi:Skp family chaperone for outer membrane proteins